MLDRLNLTHAQREQVEESMAGEASQSQMARGNPNLSAACFFSREQAIRLQTPREIASMLSPKQKQKVTTLMTRKAVKLENRASDYSVSSGSGCFLTRNPLPSVRNRKGPGDSK
jgi:hypothetical protein